MAHIFEKRKNACKQWFPMEVVKFVDQLQLFEVVAVLREYPVVIAV